MLDNFNTRQLFRLSITLLDRLRLISSFKINDGFV